MSYIIIVSIAYHISFLLNRFSAKYKFAFQILRVFYRKIIWRYSKDWYLKKMLLKRTKTRSPFFRKTAGSNNSFTLIMWKVRFKFEVTVYYSLWKTNQQTKKQKNKTNKQNKQTNKQNTHTPTHKNKNKNKNRTSVVMPQGNGQFSSRLMGSAMFGATFNMVIRVRRS